MLSAAYETACLSGPECTAALQGFSTNLTCTNALATSAQEIYCAGFCQELVNNVFSICPNVGSGVTLYSYSLIQRNNVNIILYAETIVTTIIFANMEQY